jgi:hypothetical protein
VPTGSSRSGTRIPSTTSRRKHGVDEHVLLDDLAFWVEAALHVARSTFV